MSLRTRVACAVSVATAVAFVPTTAHAVVIDDLTGPRGLAAGPGGRIIWSEADQGTATVKSRNARGEITTLGSFEGAFIAPAVDVGGLGQTWVLNAGGPPGVGAVLYRWNKKAGLKLVADIGAFQAAHPDPYNIEGEPEESNPFGVAALPDGGALVADAAHNNLLKVTNKGRISIVAWLKPRVVTMPSGYPDVIEDPVTGEEIPLPPAGTPVPSEGVATSVTVGGDGAWYVGELRGFPATPGTSRIWRVEPGSTGAICDPDAPDAGPCTEFADGLTSLVDLAPAPDGGIYALSLVKESWAAWEILGVPPIGGLFKAPAGGGAPSEVDTGAPLILPGGVDVDEAGTVWLAGPVFGPGSVSSIP